MNILKELRVYKGLSISEAAEMVGVSKQSYQATETRCLQGRITIGTLNRYVMALGGELIIKIQT